MNKLIIKIASLSVYLLLCLPVLALAGGPGFNGGVDDGSGGPCGVPLDGGLSMLAVAGIGYGIKKLKDRKAVTDIQK
jgi:hypothetical protein